MLGRPSDGERRPIPGAGAEGAPAHVTHAVTLVRRLEGAGVDARLLGGLAVAARCPSAWSVPPLTRSYSDIDMAVGRRSAGGLASALRELGYDADERFNARNGHLRQLFRAPDGRPVDVFVDRFRMCHELDLGARLKVDSITLPLADLVLTKLQVAELTEKDVRDFAAIALDQDLAEDDAGVNVRHIAVVASNDWGWWKTITDNLEAVRHHVGALGLDPADGKTVNERARELRARIDAHRKTLRWKARARVGTRLPWREDPEQK